MHNISLFGQLMFFVVRIKLSNTPQSCCIYKFEMLIIFIQPFPLREANCLTEALALTHISSKLACACMLLFMFHLGGRFHSF